jgi:hypothetical protein
VLSAKLPVNVQLVKGGLLPTLLSIPAPEFAEFWLNVQLITVELLPQLNIPPPFARAEFLLNVQLVTTGLLKSFHIPLPDSAQFLLNVQFVTLCLLLLMFNIPPPRAVREGHDPLALPAVMVKPSKTAFASVPMAVTTW